MTGMNDDKILSRMTPLNDNYQTCERTCAKLLVYPGEMHPSRVTELLGLIPTRQVVAGEASSLNSLGLRRVGKINGWFLSSEEHVESKDVRRHLDWLLGKMQQKPEALLNLQSVPGVRMTIQCIWWSRFGDGGPTLWPEQMQALAALNLECGFDFAYYGAEGAGESTESDVPAADSELTTG